MDVTATIGRVAADASPVARRLRQANATTIDAARTATKKDPRPHRDAWLFDSRGVSTTTAFGSVVASALAGAVVCSSAGFCAVLISARSRSTADMAAAEVGAASSHRSATASASPDRLAR